MLSKGEIALFGKLCSVLYELNIIPIKWNAKTEQIAPCNNQIRRKFYIGSRLFSLIYLIFAVVQLYPAYEGFNIKYPIYYPMLHLVQVVLHLFTVMFDTVISVYLTEIVTLFNDLVETNKAIGEQIYGKKYKKAKELREVTITVIVIGTCSGAVLFVVIFMLMPLNLQYYYSVTPESWRSLWLKCFFLIFEIIFTGKVCLLHLFNTVLNFLFICSTVNWLKRSCIDWPISNDESQHSHITNVYKKVALLFRLWDSCCAPALIPCTKFITYWLVVLDFFISMRYYDALPPLIYPCSPSLGLIFLSELVIGTTFMSKVFTYSSLLKKNSEMIKFKISSDNVQFRKIVISLRPLRCNMGEYYFIERIAPLTMISLVLDQVISLILAF